MKKTIFAPFKVSGLILLAITIAHLLLAIVHKLPSLASVGWH